MRKKSPHSRKRGTIYVEMLMALIPLLLLFLGVAQLSLMWMGRLVVSYAASRAARAAVVILDDDPKHYEGAPRGDLVSGANSDSKSLSPGATLLALSRSAQQESAGRQNSGGRKKQNEPTIGARMLDIRRAATIPLAVLGPKPFSYAGTSTLGDEVGSSPVARLLYGAEVHAPNATAVTVHTGSGEPASRVGPRDTIVVRVAFLMPCRVPLVAPIMCLSGRTLAGASLGLPVSDEAKAVMKAMENVTSPVLRDANLTLGGYHTLLTAEATLPNQGASYHQD